LIKGSTTSYDAIIDPSDGTVEADGGLVLNVTSGVEAASISSLTPSTTYYFKIYPYTNSASYIDYKTDETVPTSSATTEEAPPTETYVENFDTEGNWEGGIMFGYNPKTYTNDLDDPVNDQFSTNDALRDEDFIVSEPYAWRVERASDAYFMYECSEAVTEFSVYAARYSNLPKPFVTVEYSINSGTDWTVISTFNGDEFSGDKVFKQLIYNSFGSISPSAGETLQIRFRTTTGDHIMYDNFSVSYISTTPTPGLWTGVVSSDWFAGSNWDDGQVPDASTDVIIPVGATNYPNIDAPAACNNLTLESDVTGEASLIGQENLNVNENITVERYISAYTTSDNGWHFLSSPVNNMLIAGSDFVSGTFDLYLWGETVEADEKWLNYNGGTFGHSSFEEGLGYLVAYASAGVKEFTGSLNSGSYTKNLSFTAGEGDGWNLIGNPYPSGLNWNAIDRSSGNISGSFYVVNPEDGSYLSSNGTGGDFPNGHIPPHQGFFVQVSANTTITMETPDQVHTNNGFEKQANTLKDYLVVELKGAESSNTTYFHFRDDVTNQFDFHADALKLFGWGNYSAGLFRNRGRSIQYQLFAAF
jgi:hypothetical protein